MNTLELNEEIAESSISVVMQMAGTMCRAVSRKECQTSAEMFVVESIL
jgi:hypothetical protein